MYCFPGSQVQLITSQQTPNIVALAVHLDAKMGLAVIEFGFELEAVNLISVVGSLGMKSLQKMFLLIPQVEEK